MRDTSAGTFPYLQLLEDASGLGEEKWPDASSSLPRSALELLKLAGEVYLPFLLANADAFDRNQDSFAFSALGHNYSQGTFKYQVKCLRWLQDEFAMLTGGSREWTAAVLREPVVLIICQGKTHGGLRMLDLYYWPHAKRLQGHDPSSQLDVPYNLMPVNIGKGDQFKPEFARISPNRRMPALVDHQPAGGGEPIALFELGAILMYLAEKHGRFWPQEIRQKYDVTKWLMWQMGGLGPMCGQAHHFREYAPETLPYAIDRYTNEVNGLYGVIDARLADREFLAGKYSIADIGCWPWVKPYKLQGQVLEEFPNLKRWFLTINGRPGARAGWRVGREWLEGGPVVTEELKRNSLRSAGSTELSSPAPQTRERVRALYGFSGQKPLARRFTTLTSKKAEPWRRPNVPIMTNRIRY